MRSKLENGLVLVTGGAGFIGATVVRRLRASGFAVRVLDDLSRGRRSRIADLGVEIIADDVRSERAARAACRDAVAVMHLAAPPPRPTNQRDERVAHDINVTGTLNLLAAAREAKVGRFVFASSASVYGAKAAYLLHEDLAPAPTTAEGAQKLAAEAYVRLYAQRDGLSSCALRLFTVYGPGADDEIADAPFVTRFMHAAIGRRPEVEIYGDGRETRDLVHVDDVAAALHAGLITPGVIGRALNVATGEAVAVRHVLALITDLAPGMPAPRYRPARDDEPRDVRAAVTAAAAQLGFRAKVKLRDGLTQWISELRTKAIVSRPPPSPSPTRVHVPSPPPLSGPVVPMAKLPVTPRGTSPLPTAPVSKKPAVSVQSTPLFADRPPSWQVPDESGTSAPALAITDEDVLAIVDGVAESDGGEPASPEGDDRWGV
jgi:UDP-glucose 4-epimerase